MELILTIFFILLLFGLGTQRDNLEVPYTPSKLKTFEELYADMPDISLKEINLPAYIAQTKKAYIESPRWQILRKQVLKRDQYTCQGCGINGVPLEVHHITYINYEFEQLSDLVSVCRDCHQAIHDKHGYDYTNTFPLEK